MMDRKIRARFHCHEVFPFKILHISRVKELCEKIGAQCANILGKKLVQLGTI